MSTFDSTKESLGSLLMDVRQGKIQLPDFQRGWVWDDAHIQSLLASVSRSFPIGAVMMLQTGNPEVKFKPRPVEGVRLDPPLEPDRLILDGQQRLTSLYQALVLDTPVRTKDSRGKFIERWYYVDIDAAILPGADRDDAIKAIPKDRITKDFRGNVTADYTTMDKECLSGMFPLRLVLDATSRHQWMMQYVNSGPESVQSRLDSWNKLTQEVIQPFEMYQIPVIQLKKETPKEAVCLVFEKVNTGGVSLSVFELLTATFAASDFSLRDDWEGLRAPNGRKVSPGRSDQLRERKVLQSVASTDFLQAVTLASTYARKQDRPETAVSCKRADVLKLTLEDYIAWADRVTKGFERTAKLLHSENIFAARDLPYQTQLVPLAAVYAILDSNAETDAIRRKLVRWYWSGVFGELYGSAVESRFARDLPELIDWTRGGPEPSTVVECNFVPDRLLTLRTRNSAAYKGLHALLLRDGAMDFRSGEAVDVTAYFQEQIDIHHVFPKAYCETQKISPNLYNSIVNKAPLSARTNRAIGGQAPSRYLERLQNSVPISASRMDEILTSHVIEPTSLRNDDFDAFFTRRQQALLERIEQAIGKDTDRRSIEHTEQDVFDEYEVDEGSYAAE